MSARRELLLLLIAGIGYVVMMQLASGAPVTQPAGQAVVAALTVALYAALYQAIREGRRWPGHLVVGLSAFMVFLAVVAAGLGASEPRLIASALIAIAFHTLAFTLARRRLRSVPRP